jgi:hypothetical protein
MRGYPCRSRQRNRPWCSRALWLLGAHGACGPVEVFEFSHFGLVRFGCRRRYVHFEAGRGSVDSKRSQYPLDSGGNDFN